MAVSTTPIKTRPPLERMMRIHQEIASGSFPNASSLAKLLEVSAKSIQRDIEFMRDRLALPIEYDGSRWGYHYTEPVSSFPTLQITEGELVALLVAEKALEQYRGTNFEKPLVSALKKLADQLPDTVSFNMSEWDQTISFRTSAEPILNLEIFDALAKATASRRQLRFQYRKPGHKPEPRLVDPYHLANINGEWFLFGFDHARRDIRTFVPARMSELQETGQTFARPQKFSLEKRLHDSFGVVSGEGEFNVVLCFDSFAAGYIREKRWHPSQELKPLNDGGLELRMKLSSLAEVQRWVLSWGGHAQVVGPPALAQSVREAAEKLLAAHHANRKLS
jgi:predicted DNA-binding transcriptional regulator YafY